MAKKKKTYDDDDGRVVANMNVDGMPWYIRDNRPPTTSSGSGYQMTKEEERIALWGALKAGLLVAGCFILAGFLFILFCLYVWF